jgi:flagellin-like protein
MKPFTTNDDNDRGQVGIGTLIIFIALVLVAAVAAGVLINTSGELESRAADTGQDAQAEVSNQIDVVGATGSVSSSNVTEINLTVKKSAGADDIDLNDATIEYVSDSKSVTLISGNSTGGTSFTVSEITGDGDDVLDDTQERLKITVDLANSTGIGDPLSEGDDATLEIVDQSGATTVYGVNVPDTLSGQDFVRV